MLPIRPIPPRPKLPRYFAPKPPLRSPASRARPIQIRNRPRRNIWLSAIGYRLSAIGYRLSAIGYRLLAIGYWLSAVRQLLPSAFIASPRPLRSGERAGVRSYTSHFSQYSHANPRRP